MENVPSAADGQAAVLLASKHQSTWETFAYPALMPHPLAYVFKRELLYVPFFGWAMSRLDMVHIDRGRRAEAEPARHKALPVLEPPGILADLVAVGRHPFRRMEIEEGRLHRDGVPVQEPAEPARAGMRYTLDIPEPAPAGPLPEAIPLDILYEDADLIVLDEVSMVNERMAYDIESFGVPVLVLGDPFQLPPVRGLQPWPPSQPT